MTSGEFDTVWWNKPAEGWTDEDCQAVLEHWLRIGNRSPHWVYVSLVECGKARADGVRIVLPGEAVAVQGPRCATTLTQSECVAHLLKRARECLNKKTEENYTRLALYLDTQTFTIEVSDDA